MSDEGERRKEGTGVRVTHNTPSLGHQSPVTSQMPPVFWANNTTTHKSTGYFLFYTILPFNLTFFISYLCQPLSTTDLFATCAHWLQKCSMPNNHLP